MLIQTIGIDNLAQASYHNKFKNKPINDMIVVSKSLGKYKNDIPHHCLLININ